METLYKLIDIGANLTHDSFDRDRETVLERALTAGVVHMIVTGASAEGSQHAVDLAENYPDLLSATTGVHPHHAKDYSPATDMLLRDLARHDAVVAVGECGLDYFRNFSPAADQQHAFNAQLDIAVEIGKPVFLHQRDAHTDFLKILTPRRRELVGGVAHCFTGGTEEMHAYLDLGLYIGITGWICDERRGQSLREAVKTLPPDRVMLETDAPYLVPRDLPEKLPGRRNEPATLPHVLYTLANYMDTDVAELAVAATNNTRQLFRLSD